MPAVHRRIAIVASGVMVALGVVAVAGCSDDDAGTTTSAPTAAATRPATSSPAAEGLAIGVQDDRMIWLNEQPASVWSGRRRWA